MVALIDLQPMPTLEQALNMGRVRQHGRLQQIDPHGAVVSDTGLSRIQPAWEGPLQAALEFWQQLPAQVPGVELISVSARGSIPRGLALAGLSDVDTIGVVVVPEARATMKGLESWEAQLSSRASMLRSHFPFVAGLDMALVKLRSTSPLCKRLRAGAELREEDVVELGILESFRLSTQGLHLYGEDVISRLPQLARRVRPILMPGLQNDLSRAQRAIGSLGREGGLGGGSTAQSIARWAAKRMLRGGMEVGRPTRTHSWTCDMAAQRVEQLRLTPNRIGTAGGGVVVLEW